MAELRKDPITGRWIIIGTDHPMGPEQFAPEGHKTGGATCPFCPGNESMTPPEIVLRRVHGAHDGNPWTLRVVPNKFPALRIEGELDRRGEGIYDRMNGIGAHEVIIETPDHMQEITDLTPEHVTELFKLYRERSLDLQKDKRFRCLLVFKNFGESAGASLSHPHSQLIALPIVPKRVAEEIKHSEVYHDEKERCLFCDVIHHEMTERERVILESERAICFAPFVSRFPFELWILPKGHSPHFTEASDILLAETGELLQRILIRLKKVLHNPPYNFLIHTSPLEAVAHPEYHWHLEFIPRVTRVAGFEWGSGFYINPTPPELAAHYLRQGD